MPIAVIPALLRKLTAGKERVTASGHTVGELIRDVDRQFSGFANELIVDGDLKASIAVAIDGEVGTLGLLDPLKPESVVHFLPAISGGL
jgi:sulfur-carrier protein